ncbi:hypothetical protein L6452_43557 [Arctium lappa]|uniref:Uncharacterized protein n=1 Tax=Arctium lappa TaxID=4217 RepID=A0ACB8XF26_ARCLA|nr:hypothetical protein L6452_43557 [Arctium lappa]
MTEARKGPFVSLSVFFPRAGFEPTSDYLLNYTRGRSTAELPSWQRDWGERLAASISLSVTWDWRGFYEFTLLACSMVIAPLIEIPIAPVSFEDPLKGLDWNFHSTYPHPISLEFRYAEYSILHRNQNKLKERDNTRSALKSKQEPLKEAGTFRIRASKSSHAPRASHLAIERKSYASVKKLSSHRCSTELN